MSTTFPATHQDLLAEQVATFTTLGKDGSPQATVVWFLYEDGKLRLAVHSRRQKVHNLLRDPRVSLLILDPANSLRYLEVRGTATLTPDPDYLFANRVGAKYGGVDVRTFDEPGGVRYQITIEPTKVLAVLEG